MPYHVRLKEFEGPLDLLLHFISRAKVDIRDIFVSEITEQYLQSMEDISSLDMDLASEFLAMAATLLEIKSRALLPKPPPPVDPDAETPEEALIRRLAEYASLKEGVGRLHELETMAARMFEKLPEEIPLPPPTFELTNLTIDGLSAALRRVLSRVLESPDGSARIVRELPRDALSVQACMFAVASKVRQGPCGFGELFSKAPTKTEIVTIFMAVLELLRLGKLAIEQHDAFGDIMLYDKAGKTDGEPEGEGR